MRAIQSFRPWLLVLCLLSAFTGCGGYDGDARLPPGGDSDGGTRPAVDAALPDAEPPPDVPALPVCGDGIVGPGEACDHGGTVETACAYGQLSCAVCGEGCQLVAGQPSICGDGMVDYANGETCDDGNRVQEACPYGEVCSVCLPSCTTGTGVVSRCGDGVVDDAGDEQCDDGPENANTADACRTNCRLPVCGDTILDTGESCDDGNTVDGGNGCTASCQRNDVCGDGHRQALFEGCDDGNTTLEGCAYGVKDCPVCGPTCAVVQGNRAFCGDGLRDPAHGEACDDGDTFTPFVEVTTGYDHTCGVRQDGRTMCFGDSYVLGILDAPQEPLHGLSGGAYHTCGLRPDGTVACWGNNAYGQSGTPAGEFVQLDAGFDFTCGVRVGGTAECWGRNQYGQTNVPATGVPYAQVSGGYGYGCGVHTDGTVSCWGTGLDTYNAPDTSARYEAVAVGSHATCGLTTTKNLRCWGNAFQGSFPSPQPTGTFTAVSAGEFYACGLRENGELQCYGSFSDASVPTGAFVEVDVGSGFTCGRRASGEIVCAEYGQTVHLYTVPPRNGATAPATCRPDCSLPYCGDGVKDRAEACDDGNAITDACAYGQRSCSVCAASCAYGAGVTSWCGDEIVDESHGEACDDGPGHFLSLARGGGFTCGIGEGRKLRCWGTATGGQLSPPTKHTFSDLTAGANHACAIEQNTDRAYCWGDNSLGQAPAEINVAFKQLSAGAQHTCGIKAGDSGVQCWGNGTTGATTPPTGAFNKVSSGVSHTCGIRTNLNLACWGANTSGQVTPPLGSYVDVSAGANVSCAVAVAGTVTCWGDTAQLGNPPPGAFSQVSVGLEQVCARSTTGEVVCWGSNASGALDVPAFAGGYRNMASGLYQHAMSCGVLQSYEPVCWGNADLEGLQLPVMNADKRADTCRLSCDLPRCGDGTVDTGESCDDGGTTAGDGCSASCQVE